MSNQSLLRFVRFAPAPLAVALIAFAAYLFIGGREAGLPEPAAAQTALALTIAHRAALGAVPDRHGRPTPREDVHLDSTGWPSSVRSVSMIVSTHGAVQQYVGALNTSDARPVIVVQLIGRFVVETSGPPGASPYATGQVMTVVADATTGDVLDFGLDPISNKLPHATTLFTR